MQDLVLCAFTEELVYPEKLSMFSVSSHPIEMTLLIISAFVAHKAAADLETKMNENVTHFVQCKPPLKQDTW